jgi:hypothetical protein
MHLLKEWESFYVIMGSSAAALTGLQFVVMALVADQEAAATSRTIDAFGTPTIVHFGAALLLSAMLTAPWPTSIRLAVLLGMVGALGAGYTVVVARRARTQSDYQPVFEDWAFHVFLPAVAYSIVAAGGYVLRGEPTTALFAIAAAVLLLLFIGIHNSWDTVTWIVVVRRRDKPGPQQADTRS